MQQNVGILDKVGRALLSMALFGLAWNRGDKMGTLAAYSAGIFMSSAISGFCPLYKALKINTVGKPI